MEERKLIAEFMGFKKGNDYSKWEFKNAYSNTFYYSEDGKRQFQDSALNYCASWDWLMPVIDRIRNLCLNNYGDTDKMGSIFRSLMMVDIVCAHKYVVEFIKWHNSNPLHCASV